MIILVGIIPPILWALVNHTDKFLLSRTKHHSTVDVLMVYSTLFSFVVLPILFFISPADLFLSKIQILVQIAGGVMLTLSIYFYLMALSRDEASVVMPLSLLVPVFGFGLSYIILGETLNIQQIIACLLIIFGAAILSLEFGEEKKIKIKHSLLFYMGLATFLQAFQETLFKFVTIENSFVASLFWLQLGIAICGLFLLISKKGLAQNFLESIKVNGKTIFGVNVVSESVSTVAYMVRDYATLLAPVAVIMTLNGYQPVFVFIFGIILTIFLPKFVKEKITMRHLLHKGFAIAIILAGTISIAQTL